MVRGEAGGRRGGRQGEQRLRARTGDIGALDQADDLIKERGAVHLGAKAPERLTAPQEFRAQLFGAERAPGLSIII
ncbi:MAG: hypothetical protein Q8K82_13745 [Gemmatimonadaceae bacterium]|nr:hypothetical protein [Gemmatimonadaceae bacterium]